MKVTRIPAVDPDIVRNRDLPYKMNATGIGMHSSLPATTGTSGTAALESELVDRLAHLRSISNVRGYRKKWTLANGEIPEGMVIHHIDGDRRNNRLANLAILSRSDHSKFHHRVRNGVAKLGDIAELEPYLEEGC